MARKNLFERLANRWDMGEETRGLYRLVQELAFAYDSIYDSGRYAMKDFVGRYCYDNWKCRGHFFEFDDFLNAVDYPRLS